MDGTKLYLENDNWVLLRFSGTEPVLRLAVEADSPEKARNSWTGLSSLSRRANKQSRGSWLTHSYVPRRVSLDAACSPPSSMFLGI